MRVKKQEPESFLFQPFEDLKKIIEGKGLRISCKPPVAKKDGPLNDEELTRVRKVLTDLKLQKSPVG